VGTSSDEFAYGGSAPVVTPSWTTTGTGILWVNWAGGEGTVNRQLRAYNPIPVKGVLQQIWSAPSGAAVRLTQPGVGGNRIYVGGYDGVIRGYGSPVANPLSGGAVSFPDTPVGRSSSTTATFTATRPLTVTGISITSGSFELGIPAPTLPGVVGSGQSWAHQRVGSRDLHAVGAVSGRCGGDFERSMGPQRVRGVHDDRCDLHGRRRGKPDRAGVASARRRGVGRCWVGR
jgi:hypothetical protein